MTLRIAFVYHFDDRAWLGGKNYFSSLFSAIHAVAPNEVKLILIAGKNTETSLAREFPYLEVVRTPFLDRFHPLWALRQIGRIPSKRRHDPIFERLLRRLRVDVLSHSTPLTGVDSDIKCLGWLPDFQFVHMPEMWSPPELERVRRGCENVCRRSDELVVSSHAALKDLRAFAPWYHKPAHVLQFISAPANLGELRSLESLREQYQLPSAYFHLPNQFWNHKNHGVVIDALALLKAQGINATVVCTGNTSDLRMPAYFGELMQRCHAAGIEDRFRVLGVVPYVDMQALMLHAHAVINPSKFEGWSTPVEEARTMGKHVLLSDIAVHREQAPPSANYFAPDRPAELAAAMCAALTRDATHAQPEEWRHNYDARLRELGVAYLQIARSLQSSK